MVKWFQLKSKASQSILQWSKSMLQQSWTAEENWQCLINIPHLHLPKRCCTNWNNWKNSIWKNWKIWLGYKNKAGGRLIYFCQENPMFVSNIFFQQPKRHIYTWRLPDGQHWIEIHYMSYRIRWRSSIQSAKTGFDSDSSLHHKDLCAKLQFKLKKNHQTNKIQYSKLPTVQ